MGNKYGLFIYLVIGAMCCSCASLNKGAERKPVIPARQAAATAPNMDPEGKAEDYWRVDNPLGVLGGKTYEELASGVDKTVPVKLRYPALQAIMTLNRVGQQARPGERLLLAFDLPLIHLFNNDIELKPSIYDIRKGSIKIETAGHVLTLYPANRATSRPGYDAAEEGMVLNAGHGERFNHWRLGWGARNNKHNMGLSLNLVMPDNIKHRNVAGICDMEYYNKYCSMKLPILRHNNRDIAVMTVTFSKDFEGTIGGWRFYTPM